MPTFHILHGNPQILSTITEVFNTNHLTLTLSKCNLFRSWHYELLLSYRIQIFEGRLVSFSLIKYWPGWVLHTHEGEGKQKHKEHQHSITMMHFASVHINVQWTLRIVCFGRASLICWYFCYHY